MLRDLPPLAMLPAFETAARLGSFKAAADALHVTPSAISQQIKALEEALGFALFERLGRTVRLSPKGQLYLRDVQQALADLASATRRLRRPESSNVLRISTMDFSAYEPLLRSLSVLRERFPRLDLRVESSTTLVDLLDGEFDAALGVGRGHEEGITSIPLTSLDCAAVCSPERARMVQSEADVLAHPLFEVRGQQHRGWHAYAKALPPTDKPIQILTLETYFETLCAAEQGGGLAIGVFPVSTQWVLDGRLAVPGRLRVPLLGGLHFSFRANDQRPELPALAAWLQEHCQALPKLPSGRVVRRKAARGAARPSGQTSL
ncbi:MAG TPA: LysR family transcriptional regulator [Polyangiales bacterium]